MEKAYVSCIKIKGVPILPPVITSERRNELQEYKIRALKLEERYLKRKLQSTSSGGKVENKDENSVVSASSKTLETSVQMLNDIVCPMKYVPYSQGKQKMPTFSTDIIDVSEYSSSLLDKNSNTEDELAASITEFDFDRSFSCCGSTKNKLDTSIESTETEVDNEEDSENADEDNVKPRLIRSNSYVLDNPSPILLEHLKRQRLVSSSSEQTAIATCAGEYDEIRAESCSSSASRDFSRASAPTEIENVSENLLDLSNLNISEEAQDLPLLEGSLVKSSHPEVEVITTDITIQQINITTALDKDIGDEDLAEILNGSQKVQSNYENSINCDPDVELKALLQEIPQAYANKILELIEKQRIEQEKRSQKYQNLKRELVYSGSNYEAINVAAPDQILTVSCKSDAILKDSSGDVEVAGLIGNDSEQFLPALTSIQRSETSLVAGNCRGAQTDLNTSCTEMRDISISTSENDRYIEVEDTINFVNGNEIMYPGNHRSFTNSNNYPHSEFLKSVVSDERAIRRTREEKAASIIGAYVKGYLVRRLMKTSKVQTLIQTIQDALVCALELQRSETIEEADVELHRRLIQQVSAACYEFHDTFFAISIPEQMDLIAIDRDKMRRSQAIRITRSTIDLHPKRRSTSSLRLSKSLTKV